MTTDPEAAHDDRLARSAPVGTRRLVVVVSIGVALSLLPAIIEPDDWLTAVVLVVTHLVAAAIIVPALSRQLSLRPSGNNRA